MTLLKVLDNVNLLKDSETGAIINKDKSGLDEYLNKRKMLSNQKNELENIKNDIVELKNNMSMMMDILTKILNKGQ